jgi:hypothetical protein
VKVPLLVTRMKAQPSPTYTSKSTGCYILERSGYHNPICCDSFQVDVTDQRHQVVFPCVLPLVERRSHGTHQLNVCVIVSGLQACQGGVTTDLRGCEGRKGPSGNLLIWLRRCRCITRDQAAVCRLFPGPLLCRGTPQ